MRLARTIEIDSPPEELWPWLTESERVQRWNRDVVSDEPTTPGPPRVGATSRIKIREGSRLVDYESEITFLEPDQRLDLELRGGSLGANPMNLSYRMTPVDGGVRLDYTVNWQASGLMLRIMTPLLWLMSRHNIRIALARLKALAESGDTEG